MNPTGESSHPADAVVDRVTTSDDLKNLDVFGLDNPMLRNDQKSCSVTTPSSPQDSTSLTAFLQSMIPSSHDIFHPQPTLAPSYHQLLQYPNEFSSQQEEPEQVNVNSFPNGRASLQSSTDIFENGTFPSGQIPFEFMPLGAASALTDASPADPMSRLEFLYRLPAYYPNLSLQNGDPESRLSAQLESACVSGLQETMGTRSFVASGLASSQSSQDDASTQQQLSNSAASEGIGPEEMERGEELDRALSSCALVDTHPNTEKMLQFNRMLQQNLSPPSSNKRSRSVALATDGAPKLKRSAHSHATQAECGPPAKRAKPRPFANIHEATLSDLPLKHSSKNSIPKIKPKKKLQRDKIWQPASQLITPARPQILARKKIESNILPPTPDSLQRPGNVCLGSTDDLGSNEQTEKKTRKIESIEKALEALDTLTEYLSEEANTCSFDFADSSGNRTPRSPHQTHPHASLSLVSPQHFFTLGELGGRLRRRLDLERR